MAVMATRKGSHGTRSRRVPETLNASDGYTEEQLGRKAGLFGGRLGSGGCCIALVGLAALS